MTKNPDGTIHIDDTMCTGCKLCAQTAYFARFILLQTALYIEDSFEVVKNVVIEHGYSRLPVYRENLDTIEGILYVKDLLAHLKEPQNFAWQSLIRPAYFVPETKKINDLLEEFQVKKVHMAIQHPEHGHGAAHRDRAVPQAPDRGPAAVFADCRRSSSSPAGKSIPASHQNLLQIGRAHV